MPPSAIQPEVAGELSIEPAPNLSELPQFFGRIAQYPDEFIVYDDGFRGWTFRYADIAGLARSLAARLRAEGMRKAMRS